MDELADQIRAWATEAARASNEPVTADEVLRPGRSPGEVVVVQPLGAAGGSRARRRRVVACTAAAVLIAVGLAVAVANRGPDRSAVVTGGSDAAARWTRIGVGPLSARASAGVYWTGREVLVVGGTTATPCPPNASCIATDPPLQDGAAYDPSDRSWRSIADAPLPLSSQSGVVVGGDLYAIGTEPTSADTPGIASDRSFLLRYEPRGDQWTKLPAPDRASRRILVADGSRVVAYLGSHESGNDAADQVWDPAAGKWADLPRDPLAPSFDRSEVVVDGKRYLFAKDLVPNPGADGPALVRGAVFADGEWKTLEPSGSIGYGAVATDGVIVSPGRGGADGGEVGNWGRSYPYRWLYDTRTERWEDGPEPPEPEGQAVGATVAGGGYVISGDHVLDVRTRRWTSLDVPAALRRELTSTAWAGDRLVAFGGATVKGNDYQRATLNADLWQWTPPRSNAEPEGDAPTRSTERDQTSPDSPEPIAQTSTTRTPSTTPPDLPADIGRLDIAKIDVDVSVRGYDLRADPGSGPYHVGDTVLPGEIGQAIVRDSRLAEGRSLSRIDELVVGDVIAFIGPQGTRVFQIDFVRPGVEAGEEDRLLSSINGTDAPRLAISTSDPAHPELGRFVVSAVEREPVPAAPRTTTSTTVPRSTSD